MKYENRPMSIDGEERNTDKRQSLIPVFDFLYRQHMRQIDELTRKIAARSDKIDKNQAKIEHLNERAEWLSNTNSMLLMIGNKIPAAIKVIKINEEKIKKINEEKLPECDAKIEKHRLKIDLLEEKRKIAEMKAERMNAASAIIKSLFIPTESISARREIFSESMEKLRQATINLYETKVEQLEKKAEKLGQDMDKTISAFDRYDIQKEINKVDKKKRELSQKLYDLSKFKMPFTDQSDAVTDYVMKKSEYVVEGTIEKDLSPSEIVDQITISGIETLGYAVALESGISQKIEKKEQKQEQKEVKNENAVLDLTEDKKSGRK